jgi:diguanylate cyclase (GGDEF)-like protein
MLQFETAKAVRLDPLTRLPNRLSLNESLESALAEIDRPEGGFSLLLLDLDGFKLVNDHLGHPAGDEFLVQLAARLRRCTNESEIVARIGGDEFALLGPAKPEAASELADRIAAVFADPFVIDGQNIIGSTTVGIALAPRDGRTSNDLFEHVDIALYRAKKAGPATTRFFEADDDLVAKERRALQRDLEKAIERDELFILYQPLFNLSENRITGFEALLRWRHPRRGIIPPVEFIAIAEQSGLIHAIGGWAIRQACAELSRWPRDIRVSVNCSAIQFQNANILATVVRALEETEISPERLEIEITESMLIARYGSALLILQSLLELGVTVALDDFGTGFSSLTYLRKLPFRRIKVDQSFIREMLTVPDCAAIVQSVIRLAHELRMEVVAEGVETIEQLDYLRKTDCNEVQGYLIGRPMPAEKVCEMLDNQVPQTALA